jgi:hypothetical protein
VLRIENVCSNCGSTTIKRNNDSKWLIAVRSEDELRMLRDETPRYIFIVTDYPSFDQNKFDTIRIRSFEVWIKSPRCKNFIILMENYYKYIFLEQKKINPNKTPAPKNLFPDNFPFFMCNPIKTFECIIDNDNEIKITHYIEPDKDRSDLPSEKMPIKLLNPSEKKIIRAKKIDITKLQYIDEETRSFLPLRDSDKTIKIIGTKQHKY